MKFKTKTDSDRRAWRTYGAAALQHLNLFDSRSATVSGPGLITERGGAVVTELPEPDDGWAKRHAKLAAEIADAMLEEEIKRR